jgi:hypothetical protein
MRSKEIIMSRNIGLRIIAGLVLLVALAGITYFAYQAGAAQTAAQVTAQGAPESLPPSGSYYPGWHYGGGWFFGPLFFLRCLVGLFLFALAFSAFRLLLWGPRRWGMHHYGPWGRGPWGHGPWGEHGPEGDWKQGEGPQSMFDEWHRRAHEGSEEQK